MSVHYMRKHNRHIYTFLCLCNILEDITVRYIIYCFIWLESDHFVNFTTTLADMRIFVPKPCIEETALRPHQYVI